MAREQAFRLALAAALLLGLLAIWATAPSRADTAPPAGGGVALLDSAGDGHVVASFPSSPHG